MRCSKEYTLRPPADLSNSARRRLRHRGTQLEQVGLGEETTSERGGAGGEGEGKGAFTPRRRAPSRSGGAGGAVGEGGGAVEAEVAVIVDGGEAMPSSTGEGTTSDKGGGKGAVSCDLREIVLSWLSC